MRTTFRVLMLAAAILLAPASLFASASVASAAPSGGNECVLNIETGNYVCAATDKEAAGLARAAAPSATSVTIAILWDNFNFTGHSLRITASHGCSTSKTSPEFNFNDLRVPKVGLFGTWNDRLSSFSTVANCDMKLYTDIFLRGSSTRYLDSSANLNDSPSGWDDRASSLQFS